MTDLPQKTKRAEAAAPVSRVTLATGAVLCREGDAADAAFLIEKGRVEASVERSGRRIVFGERGAGEIVGEMALVDGGVRTATLTALEPTRIALLAPADFDVLNGDVDSRLHSLLTAIMRRFRETLDQLKQDEAIIKAQARDLELSLEQEQRYNRLERSFVSTAAHEIRTPLAIIDGAVCRLRRRAGAMSEEEVLRYCDKIGGSVRRMLSLVDGAMAAARLEDGALKLELGPCDPVALVGECCQRQRDISSTHEIVLTVSADAPARMTADASALEQVFTNLLSNAVKYSAGAERVEVKVTRRAGELLVAIRDFGVGVDQEDLEQIGRRFFRAKSATGVAGTGIGLNLVGALLERHGGALRIESALGEGSVFTAALPIRGES